MASVVVYYSKSDNTKAVAEFIDGLRKIDGIAWIDSVLITSREKVLKKVLTE